MKIRINDGCRNKKIILLRGEHKAMKEKNTNEKVEITLTPIDTTRKEPKLAFGEPLKNYKMMLMEEEEREYRRIQRENRYYY
ncbi:MAG: hypothetical protein E7F68_10965 [Clostridium butyricum]|nr:hypothetical protein [Clostridium butyricum]MDU3595615.1 hypothetical protein [Clostridium butyricum]